MLTGFTDGKRHFTVDASTVEGAFRAAELAYPLLRLHLFDEKGAVREHVQIFLNSTDSRDLPSLEAPLSEGDEIIILQAISGGARNMRENQTVSLPRRFGCAEADPALHSQRGKDFTIQSGRRSHSRDWIY